MFQKGGTRRVPKASLAPVIVFCDNQRDGRRCLLPCDLTNMPNCREDNCFGYFATDLTCIQRGLDSTSTHDGGVGKGAHRGGKTASMCSQTRETLGGTNVIEFVQYFGRITNGLLSDRTLTQTGSLLDGGEHFHLLFSRRLEVQPCNCGERSAFMY